MPTDDLKSYATSTTDFYALLSLPFNPSQQEIDRAWRRTALKYHPDKVAFSSTSEAAAAKEKFHLAQIGYDLLSDPTAKAIYDQARNARERKKREREVFEGERRRMRDVLEAREKGVAGVKREREEDEGEEERLERELRRLAEDGKKRRREREEALRREMEEEKDQKSRQGETSSVPNGGAVVSELDRTVKVRWPIDREGDHVTENDITTLFSTFGQVESVTMLRPKEVRLSGKQQQQGKRKKQLAAICMVQYASIVGAHAAVEDFPKRQGEEWERFDSVSWAANKEPEVISASSPAPSSSSSPATPARGSSPHSSFLDGGSRPATPTPSGLNSSANGNGPKKMPSFSSFSSAAFSTPKGSPFAKGMMGAGSPSLEELTMIRLKNAEKKRLAEELHRQDEEAAKAEADGERLR
ncbi:MAG: hypothetical protein LQ338_003760 [Usnochroma carphineum]|nr:MAG: hypothetical protein LQ338_003760 [Usnochroma carphineum]